MNDLYPSRIAPIPMRSAREDPVLHSTGAQRFDGPLSEQQVSSYEVNGYLLLENVFSPQELNRMQKELDAIAKNGATASNPEIIREPGSEVVRSVFAVHRDNPLFEQLSADSRLAGAAQQVLGDDVYIHQSRINLKPGFTGKEFYWHSDFETWHVEDGMPRMRAVSFSVLLDDNLPYNGSLMLVPGSHKTFISCVGETPDDHYKQSLRRQEYGVPDHESLTQMVEQSRIDMPVGRKGSVLMFECNTMHGSNSNITPYPRRNVFMVYNSVTNRLVDPFSGKKPRPEYIATRKPVKIELQSAKSTLSV